MLHDQGMQKEAKNKEFGGQLTLKQNRERWRYSKVIKTQVPLLRKLICEVIFRFNRPSAVEEASCDKPGNEKPGVEKSRDFQITKKLEVMKYIEHLKNGKSASADRIINGIMNCFWSVVDHVIAKAFKRRTDERHFPWFLEVANVNPVPRKGYMNKPNNYRPED